MKTTRIVAIVLALSSAAALAGRHFISPSSELSTHVFGSAKAFDAFRSASQVTAERLHCPASMFSRSLADYRRDSPHSLSQAQASVIKNLFSRRDSYSSDLWKLKPGQGRIKLCGTTYGVLFTFHSAPVVRIALCFDCDEFGVFVGDDPRTAFVNRDTNSSHMRAQLVPFVKSLYPNDREIQDLQVKR